MKLTTLLNKHFDIEIDLNHEVYEDSTITGHLLNDNGKAETISIYEKGEESEPVLVFYKSVKNGFWIVGNIYSELKHNKEYSEKEIKILIKKGLVVHSFE